ncbi:Altered inheritance of mitochondria protein 21 [Yamadazyma tenuis]|uniref:Altered inheritance of mitochondria protein 21 n=1 Tax=Candida tenuis TaxID=2315449 RepID=UPI00279EFB99|nr:Altered inheritance of mitochondria protein 21 [Yamadazyma tenuis]
MESNTPIVPKRPNKSALIESNSLEEYVESDTLVSIEGSSKDSESPSTPRVPKRPIKPDPINADSANSFPLVSQRSTSHEEGQLNSVANAEGDVNEIEEVDNDDNDGDGDKTPGNSNTKISFKDDMPSDVDNLVGTDTSSFDDDQETVSQEKEEQLESNESHAPENMTKESIIASNVMPIIPKRPAKFALPALDDSLSAKESSKETDGDIMPIIPIRPMKKKENQTDSKEVQSLASSGHISIDDSSSNVSVETSKDSKSLETPLDHPPEDENHEAANEQPISKASSETKEVVTAADSVHLVQVKPIIPIAAFQEMLNKAPSIGALDSNSGSVSRGQLSNSHIKFAQNLQGIVGKGFALPGMVDPSKDTLPIDHQRDTIEAKILEDPHEVNEYGSEAQKVSTRRAKGPRGKKLPKILSTPLSIRSESKFKIVEHNLWSVELKRITPVETLRVSKASSLSMVTEINERTLESQNSSSEVNVPNEKLNEPHEIAKEVHESSKKSEKDAIITDRIPESDEVETEGAHLCLLHSKSPHEKETEEVLGAPEELKQDYPTCKENLISNEEKETSVSANSITEKFSE